MFIGCPVNDTKAYVFPELLANLRALRGETHIHFLFDSAPTALCQWEDWRSTLKSGVTTTAEITTGGPQFGHNYNKEICCWIMRLEQRLREAFLATDHDLFFSLECDQPVLPCVPRRLARHDADIVMAASPARVIPDCVMAVGKEGGMLRNHLPANALIEVGAVGLGCTLIKRKVLELVDWKDPERLYDKYHMGGDYVLCRIYSDHTRVYPFVDTSVVVEHVDRLPDGTIKRYGFAEAKGKLWAVTR